MNDFVILNLPSYIDSRGQLTILETELPFDIQRTFWITGADKQIRGGHRHHITRQALVAISGDVRVLLDNGRMQSEVMLSSPSQCLIVEPQDWHTMHFGPGSSMIVFASHPYNHSDYITEPYKRCLPND